HELEIIGIAEPDEVRRRKFQAKFSLTRNQVFSDWQAVLDAKIKADFVIICTMDRAHFQPTLAFLKNGFDVLLEKPMSPHFKECLEMHRVAEAHNQKLTICHVLRYTPFWTKVKSMVVAGDIGDIVSIQLNENVEIMHMSHSFVRGNW